MTTPKTNNDSSNPMLDLLPEDLRTALKQLAADRTDDSVSVKDWTRRAAVLQEKAKYLPAPVRAAFHGAIAAFGREERATGYVTSATKSDKNRKPSRRKNGSKQSGHPGRRAEAEAIKAAQAADINGTNDESTTTSAN